MKGPHFVDGERIALEERHRFQALGIHSIPDQIPEEWASRLKMTREEVIEFLRRWDA